MSRSDEGQRRQRLARVHGNVRLEQAAMEYLINETPSGELRNRLTDANIHLSASIREMRVALEMSQPKSIDGLHDPTA